MLIAIKSTVGPNTSSKTDFEIRQHENHRFLGPILYKTRPLDDVGTHVTCSKDRLPICLGFMNYIYFLSIAYSRAIVSTYK